MCIKMSDVRLSNASPTLERVDARQPDSLRPSVRRCLFGSPDRAELREIFEASMQEEERRFRDTYNFDPVENRPLSPGRFVWEEWEDAPEFYRRPPHVRRNSSRRRRECAESAEERTAAAGRPRKRPSDPSGSSCSSEPQSKTSHNNKDDDQDRNQGSSQTVQIVEQTPEVQ